MLRRLRRPATLGWLIASSLGLAVLSAGLVFLNVTSSQPSPYFYGPIRLTIIYLLAFGAAVPARAPGARPVRRRCLVAPDHDHPIPPARTPQEVRS